MNKPITFYVGNFISLMLAWLITEINRPYLLDHSYSYLVFYLEAFVIARFAYWVLIEIYLPKKGHN